MSLPLFGTGFAKKINGFVCSCKKHCIFRELIAVLTIVGFATHGEADLSFVPRMGTTFFPVVVSWFLIAPCFGLFEENIYQNIKTFWRVPLAMMFAAPLADVLRSALLRGAALPLFTLILGLSLSLGMLIWRAITLMFIRRRSR